MIIWHANGLLKPAPVVSYNEIPFQGLKVVWYCPLEINLDVIFLFQGHENVLDHLQC